MDLQSLRILVADDEHDSVLSLSVLLREEGHHVRAVYRGSEVLPLVATFDPDAVFVDIAMPDRSGYDVARQIRERFGTARPLLVGVSGHYRQSADRILSSIVGFNHYLLKPYSLQSVLALLAPLALPCRV